MKLRVAVLVGACWVGLTVAASAADPSGTWMMSNGDAIVKVSNCGASICGRLVGLKKPLNKEGKPKVDKHNPNPSLAKRRLIGVTVLAGMHPKGENSWAGGTIYNPDDGKIYNASMKLAGTTMHVQACIMGFLCQTKEFKRIR